MGKINIWDKKNQGKIAYYLMRLLYIQSHLLFHLGVELLFMIASLTQWRPLFKDVSYSKKYGISIKNGKK